MSNRNSHQKTRRQPSEHSQNMQTCSSKNKTYSVELVVFAFKDNMWQNICLNTPSVVVATQMAPVWLRAQFENMHGAHKSNTCRPCVK